MLADDIITAAASGHDPERDGDLLEFAGVLKSASRFVFEADTCAAIDQVARGNLSSVVAALRISRLPFHNTWVEFEFGQLSDSLGRDLRASNFPRRVGVLFTGSCEKGTAFDCTMIASFGQRGARSVQLDPCGAEVNLLREAIAEGHPAVSNNTVLNDPEVVAWHSIIAPKLTRYMRPWYEALSAKDQRRPIQTRTGMIILRAAMVGLALLNSRNLVESSPRDLTKLNIRRNRSGKRDLLSYSEVKISLSRRDERIARVTSASPSAMREHIVRGHFKVRKGGIYWWRPFLRGAPSIGRVVRKLYSVSQPSPCLAGDHTP